MKKKNIGLNILLTCCIIVLLSLWIPAILYFLESHSFYINFFKISKYWNYLILSLFTWGMTTLVVSLGKPKLKKWIFWGWLGAIFFCFALGLLKNFVINSSAAFHYIFNASILYWCSIGLFTWIFSLGHIVYSSLKLTGERTPLNAVLVFWTGFWCFLILCQLLIGLHILYSWIIWILLAVLLVMAWKNRNELEEYFSSLFESISEYKRFHLWIWGKTVLKILLVGTLWYYFFNFYHTFLVYPVSWDWVHEYMFYPKAIAQEGGLYYKYEWPLHAMPYLWHSFMAGCYSLWNPLEVFGLTKDAFAMVINWFSWMLVIMFTCAVIAYLLNLLRKRDEATVVPFAIWWGTTLLLLTSGVWVFLLFIDNKSEMGGLLFTLLGILSWIIALQENWRSIFDKKLLFSAFFFMVALLIKPTFAIDVIAFWLISVWLLINVTTCLWAWIFMVGLVELWIKYLSNSYNWFPVGMIIIIIGLIITLFGLFQFIRKDKSIKNILLKIFVWWWSMLLWILVIKWPWSLIGEWFRHQLSLKNFFYETFTWPTIFFTHVNVSSYNLDEIHGIETDTKEYDYWACKNNKYEDKDLISTTQTIVWKWIDDDVDKYVWYWWKEFPRNEKIGRMTSLFLKTGNCYWPHKEANILCKYWDEIRKWDIKTIKNILWRFKEGGEWWTLLNSIINESEKWNKIESYVNQIESIYTTYSIRVKNNSIYLPYRYIGLWSTTFNWSVNNQATFYTEIWIIRYILWFINLFALLYGIYCKDKWLLSVSITGFIAFCIWYMIGSGIIRYWLWLFIWEILLIVLFFQKVFEDKRWTYWNVCVIVLVSLVSSLVFLHFVGNLLRISSNEKSNVFGRAKTTVWRVYKTLKNGQLDYVIKKWYWLDEVLDNQFKFFKPVLSYLNKRQDKDGVIIGWSYLPYYLKKTRNVYLDTTFFKLREMLSDFNSCRSYWRLKNNHIKYILIDPNFRLWGDFYTRYFGEMSEDKKTVKTYGVISMLAKMYEEWYIKHIFSNNLGVKYAFLLSDEEIKQEFWVSSKEEIIGVRAKLVLAKDLENGNNKFFDSIFNIFLKRMLNWDGIEDLANIYEFQVDKDKLLPYVKNTLKNLNYDKLDLNENEKYVLTNFSNFYYKLRNSDTEELANIFASSVFGNRQIMSVELKD